MPINRDAERVALAAVMVVTVAALALAAGGCAAPWQSARGALTVASGALSAIEGVIPESAEATAALEGVEAALDAGIKVVDTWEQTREQPGAWRPWVTTTLELVGRLLDVLKSAGVEVPAEVLAAVGGLQLLLPLLG